MALANIVGCAAGLTPGGAKVVEGEPPNPAACKRLGTVGEPLRELQGTPHETNPTGRPWEYSPLFLGFHMLIRGAETPAKAAPPASSRAEHIDELVVSPAFRPSQPTATPSPLMGTAAELPKACGKERS
jgi:hypothetical protein